MNENSKRHFTGANNSTRRENFLFINRHSTEELGQPQLPNRQTIGSHVQRSIRRNERKRSIFHQGSLAKKIFLVQVYGKNIPPNEFQGAERTDLKLIGNKLNNPAKGYIIVRQSPHFARQDDIQREIRKLDVCNAPNIEAINQRAHRAKFRAAKKSSTHQLCRRTNTSDKQLRNSLGSHSSYVPQPSGCKYPERNSFVDQQSAVKENGCQKGLEWWSTIAPLPYQSVGKGGADPFDAFPISILEFHDKIYPYLQQSYTYKTMEYTSPRSGIQWLQTQVQDAISMHGLYASSMAVAARLVPGECARMELSTSARRHYSQSLAIAQRRIQNKERLTKLAYDTISLLVYTYNMGDWQSYQIHFSGMRHIVILLGGIKSVDPTLSLLLLVGVSQGASHMLTRPVFSPTDWDRRSWYEDTDLVRSRQLFKFDKAQQLALPSSCMMQSSLNVLLKEVQEFHSILVQYRLSDDLLGALNNIRRWLNARFFLLTQMIVNTYCDISEAKNLGKYSDPTDIEGLEQAFLVALLCCHQLLYYAQTNPSIIYSQYIPFYHVKKHLEKVKGSPVSSPQVLEILTWISFVGAYQEVSNNDYLIRGGNTDWNSEFCLRIVSYQRMSIRTIDDFRTQLAKFLCYGCFLDPVLHRLWDLMLRREGLEMC